MSEYGFPLVPEETREYLNEKQLVDYRAYREPFVQWLSVFGKDPDTVEGYATQTVKRTAYRIGKWERWVWSNGDGYTIPMSREDGDEYMRYLATSDLSSSHCSNTQASLKRYFKWRHVEFDEEEWEPEFTFSSNNSANPRDYLTESERKEIREAALNYGSIPSYDSLTPTERSKWKRHVSQVLRKPLSEVTPDDWEVVNGWKITSLVWTSLDTGLRPIEVERARTSWVDTDNKLLRIPAQDSSKNENNWIVSLTTRTADALERWLEERAQYEQYQETDALWLTREGNPYQSGSLRRLIRKLCDEAGIDIENRKMSWYSIRHSVGTGMAKERGLAAAQAQLRHEAIQTTAKYDQVPVDERRDALDKMG